MKSQNHNQGELAELSVHIEKEVFKDLVIMSQNSGFSIDDLVVIALKRFKSSHSDYLGHSPFMD